MKHFLMTLTLIMASGVAYAGGSFSTVDPDAKFSSYYQVAQQIVASPKYTQKWAELQKQYVISQVGSADRLGRQYTKLGGMRVGPYVLMAKERAKGDTASGKDFDPEEAKFEITLETNVKFVDANGDVIKGDDDLKAVGVIETLTDIKTTAYLPE